MSMGQWNCKNVLRHETGVQCLILISNMEAEIK